MREFVNLYLLKAENPEAYRKLASSGIMVGFPATIAGVSHRPDINIGYHSTVKFFNPAQDKPEDVHNIASKLALQPPDPKQTRIEPGMFKDRLGNDVYVIKLHGDHADKIKEHNAAFNHMGFKTNFEYQPHISVDKATHDKIKESGAKTAHEAGIQFGHAELRQGDKVLHHYGQPEKLASSEDIGDLQKGALKNFAVGAAAVGTLAMAYPHNKGATAVNHDPAAGSHQITATAPLAPAATETPKYERKEMLRTIASVESQNGKFVDHETTKSGETAFGKYGLMPNTIHETIKLNPDLKQKYGKAANLSGHDLQHFMQDNPGLEDQIAEKHVARLEHHFGQNPSAIGYAWLNGVTGTYKAQKSKKDLNDHWHVKKINAAYGHKPADLARN